MAISLNIPDTQAQIIKPAAVGRSAESTVHFKLPVSFFMLKRVVEQGQWKSAKIKKHNAVSIPQPF